MRRTCPLAQKLTTSRVKEDRTRHGATVPTVEGPRPALLDGARRGASSPCWNGATSYWTYQSLNKARKESRQGPAVALAPGPMSGSPAAHVLPACGSFSPSANPPPSAVTSVSSTSLGLDGRPQGTTTSTP